jgi:pSer/pThr/pTyr-binding forkhead associated (FHA) protein
MLTRDGGGAGASARPPVSSDGARFFLVDLGSSNGTFLRIRGDVELVPGDHFRVGQQLFRVDFDGPRGVGE